MNSKIIFFCVFFFGSAYLLKINGLPELAKATPESHPFHVVVQGQKYCGGILITPNYVMTLANCVNGSTSATVYLGFYAHPFYRSNRKQQNTQIIPSSVIIIHEDFAKIKDRQYLNNVALVKLSQPATLTTRVQPGTLLSRQESYLVEGKHAEVSGWFANVNDNKTIGTVQIRNRDTCRYLFGDDYLSLGSQQFCVKWLTKTHLDVVGNTVRIGDNIIGFQTYTPHCAKATSGCSTDEMVLNFIPFLNWMSHEMNVPIEEFTNKSPESCDNHDLTKLESSVRKINETFYNDNKKLEVQNRLGEIEKVFNEQRHRMDEHVVQESALRQSLKAEIKSMNASLNKIIGFIYNDPFST